MDDSTAEVIARGYGSLYGEGGSALVAREVIAVTGPDAARYLQGQLSQDVVAMEGDSVWSLLLAPSGKVDAWVRVHRLDAEDYLLEVDAGWGGTTVTRLRRFLLRTKATIGEPNQRALVQQRWDSSIVRLGVEGPEGSLVATAIGPEVAGVDFLLSEDDAARADLVPAASMSRYRVAHAVPSMGAELTQDTIPAEAGEWLIDASVSFTKGCYTGQELVARVDSRGNNVPHPIRLLCLDADGPDVVVGSSVRANGSEVGAITSAVPSLGEDLPGLALARVGRSVAIGDVVEVDAGDGTIARATVIEPATVR
jgi:folate-binding protein YgfZ